MSNIYFTSDHHFYHNNILEFEDRPYETLEEMHEGLIATWNATINKDDIVYHLGDFVFGGYDKWTNILSQLNGKKRLVKGNHDQSKIVRKLNREGWFDEYHEVGTYIKHQKYQLWLTHYPMDIGLRPMKYSLSGHIHSTPNRLLNQVNLGVDSPLNFGMEFGKPIHIDQVIEYLNYINPFVEAKFLEERESSYND